MACIVLLFIPVAVGFYFLPSIVSFVRSGNKTPTIFLVNLFLGWTIAGWIVAAISAFLSETKEQAMLRELAYRHITSLPPSRFPSNVETP